MKPNGLSGGTFDPGTFEHDDLEAVVLFADMAGFTAFTETHGDHRAAWLADTFATLAEGALGPGDELIKTIGDAVLLISGTPGEALALVWRLYERTQEISGFPLLRVGMAAGVMVRRRGDVFGTVVNTAARLGAVAQSGQLVVNSTAAQALRVTHPGAVASIGPLRLRNFASPVEGFALDLGSEHFEHVDPVCRMHVSVESSVSISHRGETFLFCSQHCRSRFAEQIGGTVGSDTKAHAGQ